MIASSVRNENPRSVNGRAVCPSGELGYPPEWNVSTDFARGIIEHATHSASSRAVREE